MNKKIGFIGCGNMGKAILGGILNSKVAKTDDIFVSTSTEKSLNTIKDNFGVNVYCNNSKVAEKADILILAVKPNVYKKVILEIKDVVDDNAIIVTIAAGVTIENVEEWFGRKLKITRTMPNTPAQVGEAMTAICFNEKMLEEDKQIIFGIFGSFGKYEELEEKYFHGFIAVAGSSPAYVFMFIEAMADAAVQMGIPRKKAYSFAAQSVLGSAKMVLDTEIHPGQLKDMVCSPGGTTIDAVIELENRGFRAAVASAMKICEEKSKKL